MDVKIAPRIFDNTNPKNKKKLRGRADTRQDPSKVEWGKMTYLRVEGGHSCHVLKFENENHNLHRKCIDLLPDPWERDFHSRSNNTKLNKVSKPNNLIFFWCRVDDFTLLKIYALINPKVFVKKKFAKAINRSFALIEHALFVYT